MLSASVPGILLQLIKSCGRNSLQHYIQQITYLAELLLLPSLCCGSDFFANSTQQYSIYSSRQDVHIHFIEVNTNQMQQKCTLFNQMQQWHYYT